MKKLLSILTAFVVITMLFAACGSQPAAPESKPDSTAAPQQSNESNLDKSLAIDINSVVGSDGQKLLLPMTGKVIPDRPADPSKLDEKDPLSLYDMEFAGWKAEQKENAPKSPADGCIGKKVVVIINGDHPYLTAYSNGAKIAAEAFQMSIDIKSPNWDLNVQNQQIDQAINEKPDLIIVIPLDPKAAVQQFRKINQAGIPCIASNMLPDAEAMKYVLTWAGPDDFGQMAMLAQAAGQKAGGAGGVAYLTHNPGGSPYYARYNRYQAELAQKYPNMTTLDVQSPGFEADKAKQVVSDWITRFGDKLKVIQLADDSAQAVGAIEACKAAGRSDIIITAAGNSKVGMDFINDGSLYAITYQSAEADGAIPVKLAADWFNGKSLDPVYYLPQMVITKDNVDNYMPAQW